MAELIIPRRLHPFTLVQQFLKSLPALALILVPALLRPRPDQWFTMVLALGFGVLTVPLIVLQYLRFSYYITDTEIIIHSGVITRRKRNIPIDRVQNIEIVQSLLPRLIGTAKVKIETAGSQTTEGVLEYVTLDEAQRIRQIVRAHQHAHATVAPVKDAADEHAVSYATTLAESNEVPSDEERTLFTMTLRQVLLSGAFRFSLLYLAIIFSALQQLDVFSRIEDIMEWMMRGGLEPYANFARSSPWLVGFFVLLFTLLLGWLSGVALSLQKYYGFRLWLNGDKLQKRHGLLTVSEGTIPLAKVQALVLRSNPLMRRFGWYRLELQTMGNNPQQQGHQMAIPFAQQDTILTLAPHIRPFELPEAFTSVSKLTIRRAFLRYSIVLLALVLPIASVWKAALWGLFLIPLLLYLALLQYQNHGYALDGDMLYIRRGVWSQYLWVVPADKFQVLFATRSFFQRRLGLSSLIIDLAGSRTFKYPKITDMVEGDASAFLETLYARFQAQFARATGEDKRED